MLLASPRSGDAGTGASGRLLGRGPVETAETKPKRIESTLVRVTFKAALVCASLIVVCDVYLLAR